MRSRHIIAMDTHCQFVEYVVISESGRRSSGGRCGTTIPELVRVIESVRRPREVVFEEGPLADWLIRELRPHAEQVVACNPRRNALISKESDKDDPIDALKLAQLYRGGFVKAVHHGDSLERALLKRHVALYHDRVRNRVKLSNRILAECRGYGVFGREDELAEPKSREELLGRLPASKLVRADLRLLLSEYDLACRNIQSLRRHLVRQAKTYEPIVRFTALPGVKWVRAATFFAYVDTPWRFRSKQALWRYMGIGLERWHSGAGPTQVRVPASIHVCRPLKNMILGAAMSAIAGRDNRFAERYQEWIHEGLTPRNARRNVARSLAAALWGMFKNGGAYRPDWVGVPAADLSSCLAS